MRIIELRKHIVFVCLFVLMAVLLYSFSIVFSPVITTFRNNYQYLQLEKDTFKSYSALDGDFTFKLPERWTTWNQTFGGTDIVYHLYFKSDDSYTNGFVQIWNLNKPLKTFLQESKKSPVGVIDFKFYKVKEVMINKKRGFVVEYSRLNDEGKYIRAYEVFVEGNDNKVYRISFFVEESKWKSYYPIMFNKIAKSFNINK